MRTVPFVSIIFLTSISITFADNFNYPECRQKPNQEYVPGGQILFLFMVGFGERNTEEVFYVLKQVTCWLPVVYQARSAVFADASQSIEIHHSSEYNQTRDSLKKLAEKNHIREFFHLEHDLDTLVSLNETLEHFTQIFMIVHQAPSAATITRINHFNRSQLDSRYEFSLIKFDQKPTSGYSATLNVDLKDVDVTNPIASQKLQIATRNFVDDILGRKRQTEPTTTPLPTTKPITHRASQGPKATTQKSEKEEEEFPVIYIIIAAVVIILILLIIGVIVMFILRKKKIGGKNKDVEKK
ncbi:unnamed protein product [Caenorhabditis angaria]|uniref:Peptidase S72 domain-containing protein n=1 Tax=Caenorhabditis angaria TaxID=860376 RepID=A0A9P1IM58_9PELO|nr:unnamed protein product [Caenorhabditis angaria]